MCNGQACSAWTVERLRRRARGSQLLLPLLAQRAGVGKDSAKTFPFYPAASDGMSVPSLVARVDALEQSSREVSRELRLARRRVRRAGARDETHGFTPWAQAVALRVYAGAEYQAEVAAEFLRQQLAAMPPLRRPRCLDAPALARVVEDWFVALPDEEVGDLFPPWSPSALGCGEAALDFLSQHGAAQWVRSMNRSHGTAPSQADAAARYEDIRARCCTKRRGPQRLGRSLRKWASSFRRRWSLRLKRLPKKSAVPREELFTKAGRSG